MNWFPYIKKSLKKSKIIQWIQLTIPLPIGIITAHLFSKAVSYAVSGKAQEVFQFGICILCISIAEKLLTIFLKISYEKTSSIALHKCKMELYRQFLSNPLDRLFASEHGATIERLNDDFHCLTTRELSTYPSIWTGLITAAAYFFYLSFNTLPLALILTVISLLQIIPPLIVKHFLQINYDNCREIEEELSDFTAEGYHGFATIKLYDLKEWWLGKLEALHKRYLKIGNRSEATCTAHTVLNLIVENILKYGTYAIIGIFILLEYTSMQAGVTAIALSSGFYAAVNRMTKAISELSVAKIAYERLLEWISNISISNLPAMFSPSDCKLKNGNISILNLPFSWGDRNTTITISAEFSGEDISVIKGENGIGKSTLFRIITGLIPSEFGTVFVGAEHPHMLAESEFPYALCYLPQEDAPFDFTAMDFYQMLIPQHIDKVLHIAAEFGLTKPLLCQTKIRELSGGEKKKVFLSLVLSLNPILLLLDEPTNSLDFAGKYTLKRFLSQRGRGTILITHEDFFDSIADHIYLINKEGVKLCE